MNHKPFIYRVKGDFQGQIAKDALAGKFPFGFDKSKLSPEERGQKLAELSMKRSEINVLIALDNPFCEGLASEITKKILGNEDPSEYQLMILSVEYLGNV